jgi:hypothetical protein
MNSFIKFTYHHTCEYGQPAYILKSSPFRSTKEKKKNGKFKIPFLGEGFYLWEENLEAGIRWGIQHCNNKYCVVEFVDVEIKTDVLLDFLNRRDMKYFNELIDIYIAKRPSTKNWRLGNWIEFFKKMQSIDNVHFPFRFFRAEENLPNAKENDLIKRKMFFAHGQNYYTYTSPLLMICAIDKKELVFTSKSIAKQSA